MNSLPNHHFQNKSFDQLSFDGGHLTQYGGLIFFQELFSQLKLKEQISKYLVTNDQRRYCRYSDSDSLVQFLFQLLTDYGTDYACKELSADAYFPKLLEGGQLASHPTKLKRTSYCKDSCSSTSIKYSLNPFCLR